MSEPGRPPRPKLVAVPGPDGEPSRPPPPRERGPWLLVLLGVALAVCLAGFAAQARRAERLAARLAEVEASLERAEARLSAWSAWRGEVRSRADRLRAELGGLDAALAEDPGAGSPRE